MQNPTIRMLTDLERNVDRTEGRLSDAMRRMRKFIRQTEGMNSPLVPKSHLTLSVS